MTQKKSFTLGELAEFLDAQWLGEENYFVEGLAPLDKAGPSHVSFLSSEKHLESLQSTAAGIVVLRAEWEPEFKGHKLISKDPYVAFAKLSHLFDPRPIRKVGVHPTAVVAESAVIDESASIGANCVIGENVSIGAETEIYPGVVVLEDSSVGDNCLIHANVSIYAGVKIGSRVLIHSGAVIGSDGFGFAPTQNGWLKIHQLGGVIIGDDVEIGASTAIDRGALEDTIIESGVIIDNLVHIAHNVKIGERSAIAGCVGIAGSTTLGKNCIVAGMVAINGHINIADGTQFHGGTIVTKGNSEPGVFASSPPLQDVKKWRRNAVRYSQLDDYAAKIKKLEKHVFKD